MSSTLQYKYVERNNEGVWLGLYFSPAPLGYTATMMFHRNKSIVEAYITGNQSVIDRFNLLVTGNASFSNLKWALDQLEVFLSQLPLGTTVTFTVPNDRLAKIYRYWIPKRFELVCEGNNFTITNRRTRPHHIAGHDPA